MPRIDLDRVIKRYDTTRTYHERDFFYHADDEQLKELTGGTFPAKIKTTHPVIILTVVSTRLNVCPCTRNPKHPWRYRFIQAGVLKTYPIVVPEATTYIIEDKSFPMPHDPYFWETLTPHGQVPEDGIVGNFYPEGLP